MAINTNKFLPISKNTKKNTFVLSGSVDAKEKRTKVQKFSSTNILKDIEKKVIKIDSILKDSLVMKMNQNKKRMIKDEQDELKNKEKELERKVPNKKKIPGLSVPKPKLGLFDWIKNFIFNVILGFIAVRLVKHLPTLLKAVPVINKAMDFIIDWGGKLLNGLVTFIDWGYKAVESTKKTIGGIFGESGVKTFDEFTEKFKSIVNYSMIASMLIMNIGSGLGGDGGLVDAGTDLIGDWIKKRFFQQTATTAATQGTTAAGSTATGVGSAAGIGVVGATAIVAGVGLLASALGEGAFQLKKIGKGVTGWIEKNPLFNNPLSGFILGPLKTGLWILNGIGTSLDIVGAPFRYGVELIRFALMKLSGDTKGLEEQSKNLGKFDARVRDGIREQFAPILSPIFKLIGKNDWSKSIETEGSWGSLFGDKAVKDMYGRAEGGTVRGGKYIPGSARRTLKKSKVSRSLSSKPTVLTPGRSVGGSKKSTLTNTSLIETYYPLKTSVKEVKPYELLKNSYNVSSNVSFIGSLFGLSIKSIFGDSPTAIDYRNISEGLNNWINIIIGKLPQTYRYADGGFVEENEFENQDLRNWLLVTIQNLIGPRVSQVLKDLMKELLLKPLSGLSGPNPAPPGKSQKSDPNAEFQGEADFVIGDSIAHGFAGRSGNGTDTSDSKVGRKPAEVLAILKSKGDQLKGKLIDLSTGIANGTSDWTIVEEQLKYLKSIGARVRLLGVGKQWDEKVGGNQVNAKLQQLASQYGDYFYGGHNASGDKDLGLHGSPQDYTELRTKLTSTAVSGGGDIGPGGGQLRFGRTGSTIGLASGWSHAHFENLRGGMTSQYPTEGNIQKLVRTIIPAVKKMASSGLKPELARGEPLEPGKDDAYYERLIRLGVSRHTHSGAKTAVDINMPGFPFVPFALKNVRNEPNTGQGINALLGNSDTVALFHLSYKPTGYAFGGGFRSKTGLTKLHKGEFVIDKDSVDSFGIPFLDTINRIENKYQLEANIQKLMTMLDYEWEGGMIHYIEDDEMNNENAVYIVNGTNIVSHEESEDDSWYTSDKLG